MKVKMAAPMSKTDVKRLIAESKARIAAEAQAAAPKGIKQDRDRPRGSGWCGTEDCGHISHASYSEAAR